MSNSVCEYLGSLFYEATPREFYRELFPSGCLEGINPEVGKYCAIAVAAPKSGKGIRRFLIGDALNNLGNAIGSDDFTIIAPISYAGKRRSGSAARELYAICFDLDGLIVSSSGEQYGLMNYFTRVEQGAFPLPTYIVSSGTGVHLYFFLDKPLRLFPSVIERLDLFRRELTSRIWKDYITTLWREQDIQFESPLQGFRAVGSICKDGVSRVRAFKTGKAFSIDELDSFVEKKNRIQSPYSSKSGRSLSEAKTLWPEWFDDVVVKGNKRDGTYTVKRDLYDWWKRRINTEYTVGHRYWCIYALACYAQKCGIEEDELIHDAAYYADCFNRLKKESDPPFTLDDAMTAVEAFYLPRKRITAKKISMLTSIPIETHKRNGRKLETHQAYRRAIREFKVRFGECSKGGRPKGSGTKEQEIRNYVEQNPTATKAEIARALGISYPTVLKWLKQADS